METKTDELWNVKEVAAFLKIQPGTVYKWFDAGKFGESAVVIAEGPRKRTIRFMPDKVKTIFQVS